MTTQTVDNLETFLGQTASALPDLVCDSDLEKIFPLSPATFARLREKREGPAFFQVGRRYFYLKQDVLEWARNRYNTTTTNTVSDNDDD